MTTVDFKKLIATRFQTISNDPSHQLFSLEHYKKWHGCSRYMCFILGNYTRIHKNDSSLLSVSEFDKKAFRQEGHMYNVYSYSNFKYVLVDDPDFEKITNLYKHQRVSETKYCYGFDVSVHPSTGLKSYFMPLLDDNMTINRLNVNLELLYRSWKKREVIHMWSMLFTLMSLKIPAKIWFQDTWLDVDCYLPIEIAHIIYKFNGPKDN